MSQTVNGRRKPDGRSVGRVSRQDWIDAARRALIKGGVDAIKVDRLARDMKITRGSFYWHFNARQDLLDAVLSDWSDRAIEPFAEIIRSHYGAPRHQFERLLGLFSGGGGLDPALEAAVRGWARIDQTAAEQLIKADEARIAVLEHVLSALGFARPDAHARARIVYFHQIGASLSGSAQPAPRTVADLMEILIGTERSPAERLAQYA